MAKAAEDDVKIPEAPTPKYTAETVMDASDEDLVLQSFPWSNADLYALIGLGEEIRAKPEDLLLVLFRESRGFPSATTWVDKVGGAIGIVGLNQFTEAAVIGTFYPDLYDASAGKYKPEAFKTWQSFAKTYRKLMPAGQFPFIAEYFKKSPLYKQGKPFPNATSVYAANFNIGASAITDPNHVFYQGPPGKAAECFVPGTRKLSAVGLDPKYNLYCQNTGMDVNNDGKITLSDLPKFLDKVRTDLRYVALAERLRRVIAGVPTKVFGPGF